MEKKIKLIVEIPEKYYEACKDAVEESYPSQIEEVIANGTPYIPSGDLISRNAVIRMFNTMDRYKADKLILQDTDKEFPGNEVFIVDDCYEQLDLIDNAPTAPLPDFKAGYKQAIIDGRANYSRSQGEWINPSENPEFSNREFFYDCSICGNTQMDETNFCPNCGADMREGAKNECDCK